MKQILFLVAVAFFAACQSGTSPKGKEKQEVDQLFTNGTIYTLNKAWTVAEVMVIHEDKIVFVGTKAEALERFVAAKIIDLKGKVVYPGFIDGHCHFLGYGRTLFDVDLVGTMSFDEVVAKTTQFFGLQPKGWVKGRGWDQNDWKDQTFPTKDTLDILYPNVPVILRRVDGHAALVNQKALELANITAETVIDGGEIMKNASGGLTGILLDHAVDSVMDLIPENIKEQDEQAVAKAQANCFSVGLTSVTDAGLPLKDVLFLKKLADSGQLKIRVYQMVSHSGDAVDYFKTHGPIVGDFLTVQSFKCYMDGALGSRGAWLKQPYTDMTTSKGLQLTKDDDFKQLLVDAYTMDFQVCTHAIGDKAVEIVLKEYAQQLGRQNDRRWRVEHSQVVDSDDMSLFGEFGIIPSVQPTHATSDMYWAKERLGSRVHTAYAYKELLEQNGFIVNGSDFPVEDINPLYGFYAATMRQDQKGYPANGFQRENKLSPKEALMAMTVWAAYAQFEEGVKGSLEAGKFADFVIMEQDLLQMEQTETYKARVLETYVGGKLVYAAEGITEI